MLGTCSECGDLILAFSLFNPTGGEGGIGSASLRGFAPMSATSLLATLGEPGFSFLGTCTYSVQLFSWLAV
jgi:hypothetical protein